VEDWTFLVVVALVVGCLNGEYTNILGVETQNDVVPSVVGEPWTEHAARTKFREHRIDVATLYVTHVNCSSEWEEMLVLDNTTV
jgi:hypothetical protein